MRLAVVRFRLRRTVILVLLVGLGAVAFAGCANLRGGQTVDAATARIEVLAGVASAEVSQVSSLNGFTRNRSTFVEVTLERGYHIEDSEAALEWVVRTAWSVNGQKPTSGLWVGFVDASGEAVDWDWVSAVKALGYESPFVFDFIELTGNLSFDPADIGDSLGSWPGEVPQLADGVILAD